MTPTLGEVLKAAIADALTNVNVSLPGVVESYDGATNSVNVTPSLHSEIVGQMPIINAVPVVFPRGGSFKMKWDLKKGDHVILIFSQRSLDNWKSTGGVLDPQDPRTFHISDAVAFPGGAPFNDPITVDTSDRTVLMSGSSRIDLMNNGKFKIAGAFEYLDLVSQMLTQLITLADKLSTDKVNTSIGPQPLNFFSDYATVKSQLTTLKSNLDSIKG